MSAGKIGGFDDGPQIRDMALRPGRDYPIGGSPDDMFPGFGRAVGGPAFGIDNPGYDPDYNPGYQRPPQYQQPLPQQDNQQYYQQMRKSIDGMNEAFSQIEKMQMPGGQYQGGGRMMSPGGKSGKGASLF